MNLRPTLLIAAKILLDANTLLESGGLLVVDGRVERVLRSRGAVQRAASGAQVVDFGDVWLAPGWVNAHCHLEMGALRGKTPRGGDFGAWVRSVLTQRAAIDAKTFELAVANGADQLVRSGVTSVADIDSTGAWRRGLARSRLRAWIHREVIDAHDSARTKSALRRVTRALPAHELRREGFSPHAPFTVSSALLAEVARLSRSRSAPVAMHWSETEAELQWLLDGAGPLAALLGPSPRASGLDLVERAGLLRAPLALIHGNHPARGEPARIAAAGAVVVHCPGSHAWFAREPFAWRRYLRAGVTLALGTDSLASNEGLDMGREMRLAREAAPWLSPERVFEMATRGGAAALGRARDLGALHRGAHADVVAHRIEASTRRAALEALTHGASRVGDVWIGGRAAFRAPDSGATARATRRSLAAPSLHAKFIAFGARRRPALEAPKAQIDGRTP